MSRIPADYCDAMDYAVDSRTGESLADWLAGISNAHQSVAISRRQQDHQRRRRAMNGGMQYCDVLLLAAETESRVVE